MGRRNATGRLARALAAAVVGLSCWSAVGGAQATEYRLIVLESREVKWGSPEAGTGADVTYAVVDRARNFAGARNCAGVTPLDGLLATNRIGRAVFDRELEAAFAAWSNVADIRFRMTDAADADILIGAETFAVGRAFTNVEYVETGRSTERTSLTRSVICLNPEQGWKVGFDGDLDVYDLRYTLTHEIGHAIGLDHPGRKGELMDFRYREAFRVPQPGDIAGAVFLYGAKPVVTASRADLIPAAADAAARE